MTKVLLAATALFSVAAVTVIPPSQKSVQIQIDGQFDDWAGVPPIATDKNEGATPCDWRAAYVAKNDESLFFRYKCESDINFDRGAAYNIFLDTDRNRSTGFQGSSGEFPIGADYLIQGATVFAYSGDGRNWSWKPAGTVNYRISKSELELSVPWANVGAPKTGFDFFLYGDNEAPGVGGKTLDVCPDDALDATGTVRKLSVNF